MTTKKKVTKKTAMKKTLTSSSNKTKQSKHRKHTVKDYKKAINGSLGIQLNVAEQLGVTRGAVSLFLDEHSELRELISQEGQLAVDKAEDVQFALLEFQDSDDPVPAARVRGDSSKFILSRRRASYKDKQELEHVGNTGVIINLIEKSVEEIKRDKLTNKSKAGSDTKGT